MRRPRHPTVAIAGARVGSPTRCVVVPHARLGLTAYVAENKGRGTGSERAKPTLVSGAESRQHPAFRYGGSPARGEQDVELEGCVVPDFAPRYRLWRRRRLLVPEMLVPVPGTVGSCLAPPGGRQAHRRSCQRGANRTTTWRGGCLTPGSPSGERTGCQARPFWRRRVCGLRLGAKPGVFNATGHDGSPFSFFSYSAKAAFHSSRSSSESKCQLSVVTISPVRR